MSETTTDTTIDPGPEPGTGVAVPATGTVAVPAADVPATRMSSLVESYKREVALPGAFDATYPGVSEDDILGALDDAFAEAQLDGFFPTHTIKLTTHKVTPELSGAGKALIVVYAGIRWIRTEIRGMKTSTRYKAGPVEYEVAQGVGALTQLLKDLTARKDALLAAARYGTGTSYVLDGYLARSTSAGVVDFAPAELPGAVRL